MNLGDKKAVTAPATPLLNRCCNDPAATLRLKTGPP